MLNAYIVQFDVTTAFFFSIYARLDTLKTCLWSAQGTKESFEKTLTRKKNALTFFFLT